jgi:type IV secretion system protein TrbE
MWKLKTKPEEAKGFSDLLPWATLADPGLVITKRGGLVVGFYFRPPDADSASDETQAHVSARINEALLPLGDNWAIWADACSVASSQYPPRHASDFPDPISAAVDEERREHFEAEGEHFENERVLIICYTPPREQVNKWAETLYTDQTTKKPTTFARIVEAFQRQINQFEDQVGGLLGLRRMQSYKVVDDFGRRGLQDELVNYLHYCATGKPDALMLPPNGNYLDCVIGGQDAYTGETPVIGGEHIACVAIDGFPGEHFPNILARLSTLPFPCRFSQRMIYLNGHAAVKEIGKFKKLWGQKTTSIGAMLTGQTATAPKNAHAVAMQSDADIALALAESGTVIYGWYTAVVTVRHADSETVQHWCRLIVRQLADCGFAGRIETTNTMDAWRGALPGETFCNVRRPLIHTANLADFWPLSGVWTGLPSNPCPMYPQPAPPLLHAATVGAIPFRLNLHVGDVGHTLVFGPTGKGKSTLLSTVSMQALRYPGMQITAFDYKRGLFATVKACGGRHFELGGDSTPALCPLGVLDSENDLSWAEGWLEASFQLQTGQPFTPQQRQEVHFALERLAGQPYRSLSDFLVLVQDKDVADALRFYTLEGAAGYLLDARGDSIDTGHFNVFETMDLMALEPKAYLPVLLYLFRRFERGLDGRPAMLFLDEAWVALGNPVWREKLRSWLRLLRSKNCAVVMATQSLSDASRSGLLDALVESCPTKIYLPNDEALKRGTPETPGPNDLYRAMGLNDNQIEIIRTAMPKREYYIVTPEGCRLVDLALGPLALAFAGATSEADAKAVRALVAQHGDQWMWRFLDRKGVTYAHYLPA